MPLHSRHGPIHLVGDGLHAQSVGDALDLIGGDGWCA
jgi:hypothetical protein